MAPFWLRAEKTRARLRLQKQRSMTRPRDSSPPPPTWLRHGRIRRARSCRAARCSSREVRRQAETASPAWSYSIRPRLRLPRRATCSSRVRTTARYRYPMARFCSWGASIHPASTLRATPNCTIQAGTFNFSGNLGTGRQLFMAALLGTGNVVVAGGLDTGGGVLSKAEIYLAFAAPPLKISTLALSAGNLTQAYNAALQATGGTGSLAWALSTGKLPPGIALSPAG